MTTSSIYRANHSSSRRWVSAVTIVIATCLTLIAGGSRVARADSTTSTPGYDSMAAAMVSYWANANNTSTATFMQDNASQLSGLIGTSPSSLLASLESSSAASTPVTLSTNLAMPTLDTSALNSLINQNSPLNFSSLPSMSSLFSELRSNSSTIDGATTLNGITLANMLGKQYAPALATSKGLATQDSALFGAFYDTTLANLVGGSPNLFKTVSASGLSNPATTAAWNKALAKATAASTVSLSSLPDQCGLVMMESMANGSASSSGSCGACAVAGTYLHSQLPTLLNPASNSVLPSTGTSSTNSSSWSSMQGWLQQGALSQNSSLASALNASSNAASESSACAGSSAATSGALSSTLPGVFANLGK